MHGSMNIKFKNRTDRLSRNVGI